MDRLKPGRGGGKDRKAPLMARIGPKIKHTRLLKGLTLRDLADAAGCSESLLSKIENGRANPSLKMIHRVASALGTPVAGLSAPERQKHARRSPINSTSSSG